MYLAFKFLHILGVVLLLGNVTVSAVWKVFANRTQHAAVIGFAQRLVTYTDWSLTLGGVLLVMVGGYGMVHLVGWNPGVGWLLWGQILFFVSGVIWLARLVPLQVEQARSLDRSGATGEVEPHYWVLCRSWIAWGVVATVPLVIATYLMVAKS